MYPHVCDQPALLKRITYRLCFATNTETFGNRFTFSYFQFNFSFSFSFLVFCFLIFCLSLIFIYPAVGGRHDKCRDFLDIYIAWICAWFAVAFHRHCSCAVGSFTVKWAPPYQFYVQNQFAKRLFSLEEWIEKYNFENCIIFLFFGTKFVLKF